MKAKIPYKKTEEKPEKSEVREIKLSTLELTAIGLISEKIQEMRKNLENLVKEVIRDRGGNPTKAWEQQGNKLVMKE